MRRVILDPGHGGIDPRTDKPVTAGKQSPDGEYIEGEAMFRLALIVAGELAKSDVPVALTRDNYYDVPLSRRVKAALPDDYCFVSLHSNAAGVDGWADDIRGHMVFYYVGSKQGYKLASAISGELSAVIPPRRTIEYRRRLYVLRKTPCPAALVETGFHTSHVDVRILTQHADIVGAAIARGILAYLETAR